MTLNIYPDPPSALTLAQMSNPADTTQGIVSGQLLAEFIAANVPQLTTAQAINPASNVEGLVSGATLAAVKTAG